MNDTLRLILIIAVISVIVVIVANIELVISRKNAIYRHKLIKNFILIKPEETGLSAPVFVFNSKNVKARDIPMLTRYDKDYYYKYQIEEHLASRLNRPIKEFFSSFKEIPKSKTPFSKLYNVVVKGEMLAASTDPAATFVPSNYKVIHSKEDDIEIYIANDEFYIFQK